MIYFADRQLNILGQASTDLPGGLMLSDDVRTDDVESGVSVYECKIQANAKTAEKAKALSAVGNYLLRSKNGRNEFYTIIDREWNSKKRTAYIYAEDAGLDLLNEVVGEYEADKAYPITHYVEKFAYDCGFVIGVNEASGLTRKLKWEGEQTVTARLASVATQFDGCEIAYSFDIEGLTLKNKYINIYRQRGKDVGDTLRLNVEIDSIITTESIANLATALRCTGGTPDGAENPITLRGYTYDDGDFYVDGDALKSREALKKWSRYIWAGEPNLKPNHEGHIVKLYSYDTPNQATLCAHAITELKKLREIEANYEAEIARLPDNVRIGDRVNLVDETGKLYLSTRLLKLEESECDKSHKATFGEYLIKSGGIHQKVAELAAQFAKTAYSAAKAYATATKATEAAEQAKEKADTALADAEKAKQAATEATTAASNATQEAEDAKTKADNAQTAVDNVEKKVTGLETTVTNAQQAAQNAQQAAQTAQEKAVEAAQAAAQAKADAESAKASVTIAQEKAGTAEQNAQTAITKADDATSTATDAKAVADAAKLDAENAQNDIDGLWDELDTVSRTMEADYARKTDLTETEAHLQTQIEQNAAGIQSTASKVQSIDETANNAQALAEQAQEAAEEAQAVADLATADAQEAQEAADQAAMDAENAQGEADKAQAAADEAQAVADKAAADLEAAEADLATISAREDATQEEIEAAEQAVADAQAAAEIAQADAQTAAEKAVQAQQEADTALASATEAQETANAAKQEAETAQKYAETCNNEAVTAAIQAATWAKYKATDAQRTADKAKETATEAQAAADQAAQDATGAQATADSAASTAAQAETDLQAAKDRLAEVMAQVGATEAEIAEAENAVAEAQEAADQAQANADAAQSAADQAQADAVTAQNVADEAKTAADEAQAAATEAQEYADRATAAVGELAVRLTNAETQIKQNADAISLRATKEEVTKSLSGVYTKEETEALLNVKADEISGSVKTVQENLDVAEDARDEQMAAVTAEIAEMKLTSKALELDFASLEENGTSKVKTSTGFTFDEKGMTVDSTESPTKTQVTPDGMTVNKKEADGSETEVLTATSDGVDATNLHAKTYLIVGETSRFEDYNGRTGCFWIGG